MTLTHEPAYLAVDALATYRLTVLAVEDTIFSPIRNRIVEGSRFGMELITCPWCISIWLGAAVVLFTALAPVAWFYLACVLAFSAVAGLLSSTVR